MTEPSTPRRSPLPHELQPTRSGAADATFAEVAKWYLERHVRRHLVPRAYTLAGYAHVFLETVSVPGPAAFFLIGSSKPYFRSARKSSSHRRVQTARSSSRACVTLPNAVVCH